MHDSAYHFIAQHIPDCTGLRVIEFGSYNVNGSVRTLCHGADEYIGIDVRPGPGVDYVWDGSFLRESWHGAFDLVISTETLEHTHHWRMVVQAMCDALKPGGLLLITAANPERQPHGCNGEPWIPEGESYQGIAWNALQAVIEGCLDMDGATVENYPSIGDVYATARKRV